MCTQEPNEYVVPARCNWCSHPVNQVTIEDKHCRVMRCCLCNQPLFDFTLIDDNKGRIPSRYVDRFLYTYHTTVARIEF